ncbi:hypothetical protein FSP39_010761 [Pinctada imbricata]|uniref:F-box domain-containing protein n=1 Tax=Pinctada imbricata TaxID=66713 RepID=A0AA88XFC3_PINIB|nr:hypothetical protein FSP39_010761 [Pinctada imbricata]
MEQSKWANLPDLVILEIYKYLSDADRLSTALVCKNWLRMFHAPCLWRWRSFDMGGYRALKSGIRACQFAEILGSHLRYLTITCNHPSYHTAKVFQKAMEDLLLKIRSAKIVEFEMEKLELDRFWKYETARDKLTNNLVRFFKGQVKIRMFDMTAAQFPALGGIRILETVGSSSGEKVEEIYLEDFFHSRIAAFQIPRFVQAITCFKELRFIAINYNCVSDEILEIFAKSLKGKLRCLNMKVYRNDPHRHQVSPYIWKRLRNACPKLRVTVWIESIGFYEEVLPVLSKDMPLREFHMWTGYDDDAEWRLHDTIYHLTNTYTGSLESVSLEMDNNHEIVDEALLALLGRCKLLRELTLNAVVMVPTIEVIMHLITERKINLQSFHFTACGISETEWLELCEIKDMFTPVIEERGLNIKFTTDLLIDVT